MPGITVHPKSAKKGPVSVIHLEPVHPVLLDEALPIFFRVSFINADDGNFAGINLGGEVLQQRQRPAAGCAPRAPEIQQDNLALERIQADLLSAAQSGGKLRSIIPANAAGV